MPFSSFSYAPHAGAEMRLLAIMLSCIVPVVWIGCWLIGIHTPKIIFNLDKSYDRFSW